MADWHPTLPEDSIGEGGVYSAQAGTVDVIIMRVSDGLVAYRDACPHEGYPLSKVGELDGDLLICNKHLWEFDGCTGRHVSRLDRPLCNLVRYPLRVTGGIVEIDTDISAPPVPKPASISS